jgi:TonB-linked SusC/RagA family outer membrane protein
MNRHYTVFFVIIAVLASLPARSQIHVHLKNASFQQMVQDIQAQSDYTFFYDSLDIVLAKPITLSVDNMDIRVVLQLCFRNQPLSYRIDSLFIFVQPKSGNANPHQDARLGQSTLWGQVLDSSGAPIAGATIALPDKTIIAATNEKGMFQMRGQPSMNVLISHIGYISQEVDLRDSANNHIYLKPDDRSLEPIVVYSTGYQKILPEQSTGAYDYIDHNLLDRSVSTDVLSKLDGIASGVLFNPVVGSNNNAAITIGGRSTIFSNPNPLIVLDDFPFSGNIYDINPNDIESITILKDAAAASIWGVQAGNGVIVITSKHGQLNRKAKVSFNTSFTVGGRPNLWAIPQVNANDFVNLQEYLYNQGYFEVYLQLQPYWKESPVVDLLDSASRGLVKMSYAQAQINQLRNLDVRYQQSKYLYRPSLNQQYALNVQGGTRHDAYFASLGYDNNIQNAVGSSYTRFTGNVLNTLHLAHDKLLITTNVTGTASRATEMAYPYIPNYPFEQIADAKGNALPVYPQYRVAYTDTVGEGLLRPWGFYPLEERNGGYSNQTNNAKFDLSIKYKILPYLSITAMGEYQTGASDKNWNYGANSYYVRSLINLYSVVDYVNKTVSSPVPSGGVDQYFDSTYNISNGRLQLDFGKRWRAHRLDMLAGMEANENNAYWANNQDYGVGTGDNNVNFNINYPMLTGGSAPIPTLASFTNTTARYRSFYGNVSYGFKDRYHITASARHDEANIFGADANHRGVPLGSVGLSWDLDKEKFYPTTLPLVRIRLTDGYNGNTFNALTAYTTSQIYEFYGIGLFGSPYAVLNNPPDPDLTWEKVHIYNLGTEISSRNERVRATLDMFLKYGLDLIGNEPTAPQTGNTQFTGNNSSTRTKGADMTIHTVNLKGRLSWSTDFLWSYAKDIVTNFKEQQQLLALTIFANYTQPLHGYPYEAVFSFPFHGLDSAGNPMGVLNGKRSENYSSIINSTNNSNLQYNGSYIPTSFGAIRNTFTYKHWELSANITFKLGYVFRRDGLNYGRLFAGGYIWQPDYDKRWQQPGDERFTTVPSQIYPDNGSRDDFYSLSSILVDKADQIRWQDIRLSYTMTPKNTRRYPFSSFQIYSYVNNVGILWRANKDHIDPDTMSLGEYGLPVTTSYSLGVRCSLK